MNKRGRPKKVKEEEQPVIASKWDIAMLEQLTTEQKRLSYLEGYIDGMKDAFRQNVELEALWEKNHPEAN